MLSNAIVCKIISNFVDDYLYNNITDRSLIINESFKITTFSNQKS